MKNSFFNNLRRVGTRYSRDKAKRDAELKTLIENENVTLIEKWFENDIQAMPVISLAESEAFKSWAIAEYYNSSDIVVDVIPEDDTLLAVINVFRAAKVNSLVLTGSAEKKHINWANYGCCTTGPCVVSRKETRLYNGKTEYLRGLKLNLDAEQIC